MNDERLQDDEVLNLSGDEWECESEECIEDQLGDPDDPGPQLATPLGLLGGTLERVNEVEIMTEVEEETCCSSTFEEASDRDYEELQGLFDEAGSLIIGGLELMNMALQMHDSFEVQ